jgi:DNA repair exonuclease SbcCD ATPase subunit
MEDLKARLKSLFEANKEQEALFATVDGQVFFNEADAHNHAQRTGEPYTKHSRNGNALAADAEELEKAEVALREEIELHDATKAKLFESEESLIALKEEFLEKLEALQEMLDARDKELAACKQELEALKVANPSKK